MQRRLAIGAALALPMIRPGMAAAQGNAAQGNAAQGNAAQAGEGLVTLPSPHPVAATLDRFEAAVRAQNWVVFTRIDHAAAATAVGLSLKPRTVVIFGNPRAGTPAMAANPTLALDLPLRVLVWEDDQGRTQVTRNTGAWMAATIYARHGITLPPPAVQGMEALLAGLVEKAVQ